MDLMKVRKEGRSSNVLICVRGEVAKGREGKDDKGEAGNDIQQHASKTNHSDQRAQ